MKLDLVLCLATAAYAAPIPGVRDDVSELVAKYLPTWQIKQIRQSVASAVPPVELKRLQDEKLGKAARAAAKRWELDQNLDAAEGLAGGKISLRQHRRAMALRYTHMEYTDQLAKRYQLSGFYTNLPIERDVRLMRHMMDTAKDEQFKTYRNLIENWFTVDGITVDEEKRKANPDAFVRAMNANIRQVQ
jgi:hypothetical protein